MSRVLAEPTLTAISGETAKFTAGGEIPIPKARPATRRWRVADCTIGVEYKPYGVTLELHAHRALRGRISLAGRDRGHGGRLREPVADRPNSVPAMKVRKSETTVELPSGSVMMTAGLIQQTNNQAINGVPGLLNLPVLGALFRSRDYQRKETELMIMVTPLIAKPMEAGQGAPPDDGFVDSHDGQAILLGRLNRLYGVAGRPPAKAKYQGPLRLHQGLTEAHTMKRLRTPATWRARCFRAARLRRRSDRDRLDLPDGLPRAASDRARATRRTLDVFVWRRPRPAAARRHRRLRGRVSALRPGPRHRRCARPAPAPSGRTGSGSFARRSPKRGCQAGGWSSSPTRVPIHTSPHPSASPSGAFRPRWRQLRSLAAGSRRQRREGQRRQRALTGILGCAMQTNVAAQTADPVDLVRGRARRASIRFGA